MSEEAKGPNFNDPQNFIDSFVSHEMDKAKQAGITGEREWAQTFIYKHYSPPSEGELARVSKVQSQESLILYFAKNADIAVNGCVSEACGAMIDGLAKTDYDTEVLARAIIGDAAELGVPYPKSLRELAGEIIGGKPLKAKQGDHGWDKKTRSYICLECLSVLVFGFGMKATKNEASRGVVSACDLISAASSGLGGLSITVSSADSVWRKRKNLRKKQHISYLAEQLTKHDYSFTSAPYLDLITRYQALC